MLKEAVERFRDYFYEYPKNPVELNETELNVKSLMPKKDEVDKGLEPITTKELKERAEEQFGIRQDTARKKAYLLKKMGVADKVSKKEWVKTDRYRKLSEKKLRSFFVLISIAFLVLSIVAKSPWPVYFSAVILTFSFAVLK